MQQPDSAPAKSARRPDTEATDLTWGDDAGSEPSETDPAHTDELSLTGPPGPTPGLHRAIKAIGFHVGVIALFAIPAIALWWNVWTTHPSTTMTCSCGDPAQQVWFTAWPAFALAHLHSLVFSHWVNVPDGANLLSNTSGTLVSVVLAPITWAWGPVVATNVALTLAPALSAWGCFVAVRSLVTWKWAAVPAALIYGYSTAMITSIVYGHISLTVLVVPPILFSLLHEIVIRQEHSVRRDGLFLAALVVIQFWISPEVLVMCALLTAVAMVPVLVVGWRQIRVRSAHALPALALGVGIAVILLAYPVWFGLHGPQSVTGVLFLIAPISGVPLYGIVDPGPYGAPNTPFEHIGGYLGHNGPTADYIGIDALVAMGAAVIIARRRALVWLVLFVGFVAFWLSLGSYLVGVSPWLSTHLWLPWHRLSQAPILKEILPDQFAAFIALFVAFLLALGLDALYTRLTARAAATSRAPRVGSAAGAAGGAAVDAPETPDRVRPHDGATVPAPAKSADSSAQEPQERILEWCTRHRVAVTSLATLVVAAVGLIPTFITYDLPLTVESLQTPTYYTKVVPSLPADDVFLTIPFPISGEAQPMLWQAIDGFHFRLAGAALKTPNAAGGPVQHGLPGSARWILTGLSDGSRIRATGTASEILAVRYALVHWHVDRVVIAGSSIDPVYASGFFTETLGTLPVYDQGAWVWDLKPGWKKTAPAYGAPLAGCRVAASAPAVAFHPLFMANCVLSHGGRTA